MRSLRPALFVVGAIAASCQLSGPPVALDDVVTSIVDQPVTVDVLANDYSSSSGPMSVVSISDEVGGTVAVTASGVVFTPTPGRSGPHSFRYVASDGSAETEPATVIVHIPNQPPLAVDDEYAVAEGGTTTGNVLDNDADPDGDPMTATLADGPDHGTIAFEGDGTFRYVHDGTETDEDTFTYEAGDGEHRAQAVVVITVRRDNDPPVAADDVASVAEGGSVIIDVLANDDDPENDPLVAEAPVGPEHGTIEVTGGGEIRYRHDGSEDAEDSFTYRASDGIDRSEPAVVTISIDPVNDPPVARNASLRVDAGGCLTGTVPADDAEGDRLTIRLIRDVDAGALTLTSDGRFEYCPTSIVGIVALIWPAQDAFSYEADDGAATDTATVSIVVNTAPVVFDDELVVSEGGSEVVDVLDRAEDRENDALTLEVVKSPDFGTVEVLDDGTVEYTHNDSETTLDAFTYLASDGSLDSAIATIFVNILPVNEPPIARDDGPFDVARSGPYRCLDVDVLANDEEPDGDEFGLELIEDTVDGSLDLVKFGVFRYCHDPDDPAVPDRFRYLIDDGRFQAEATVTFDVSNAPSAIGDDLYLGCDPETMNLKGSDADGDSLRFRVFDPPATGTLGPIERQTDTLATITYIPAVASYTDEIVFEVSDGRFSDDATITLDVTCYPPVE